MKRMSSLRLTETPMPVALILSLSLRNGLLASVLLGGLRRHRARHLARALGDRFHDVVVAGAAADVALEPVADRSLVKIRALAIDEVDRGHDHARRAEAALQAVVVLEGLLHRMQLAALSQALDCRDVRPLAARGEDCAGLDRDAVEMDDAGPALGGVAAHMRAGEAKILAQELHEQRPGIHVRRNLPAVHRHRDMNHSHILLNQDCFGVVGAEGARACPGEAARAASAKLAKNLSAMLLATLSMRRDPSWAILPPTCASTL